MELTMNSALVDSSNATMEQSTKHMSDKETKADGPSSADARQTRRELLKNTGSLAAYVAPAMVVLLEGDSAQANHRRWHVRFCRRFPNHWSCTSRF